MGLSNGIFEELFGYTAVTSVLPLLAKAQMMVGSWFGAKSLIRKGDCPLLYGITNKVMHVTKRLSGISPTTLSAKEALSLSKPGRSTVARILFTCPVVTTGVRNGSL